MESLEVALATVRDRIEKYRGQAIGESNTKSILIEPVLRALGWDVEDLDEVRREYKRKPSDNPVDYAFFLSPIHRWTPTDSLLKRGIGRPLNWEDRSVNDRSTQIKEHPIDAIIAQPRPTRHDLR